MNFKRCVTVGLFLVATDLCAAVSNDAIHSVNNSAGFSADYSKVSINNSAHKTLYKRFNGHELGLDIDLTKTFMNRLYTQASFFTTSGNFTHRNNLNLTPATIFMEKVAVRIGLNFYPSNATALTPYFSTGYQFLQFDTGGTPSDGVIVDGVTKSYQNTFIGIGLLGQWSPTARMVLMADAEYGKTLHSWLSYNEPNTLVPGFFETVVYQQRNLAQQPYYRVGLSGDYKLRSNLHGRVGVQYDSMKTSSAKTNPSNIYVPGLNYRTWTYKAGMAYDFDEHTSEQANAPLHSSYAIVRANNQASILAGYLNQNYAELPDGANAYLDREAGIMPFMGLALTKTWEQVYTQLNASMVVGDTQYYGHTNFGEFITTSTRNNMLDLSARIGYMYFPTNIIGLTPYIAGGYHRWLRNSNGIPVDNYAINATPETYQHTWYGIGLLAQLEAKSNWVLGLDGNYGMTHNAGNRGWSAFVSPNTREVVTTLEPRPLYSIGVQSDYTVNHVWHALAGVSYLRFKYGQSPKYRGIFEPYSRTTEIFYSVGVGYSLAV